MTIFYPDVSRYDADRGVRIEPGTVAVIARATLSTSYSDPSFTTWRAQAAQVGAVFGAYHWLNHGRLNEQAQWAFQHVGSSTPLMVDAEDVSGNTGYSGVLTVPDINGFVSAYRQLGGKCHLVYLPHWYWLKMGSPDLSSFVSLGLHLVSSNYTAYSDDGPGWAAYGGVAPTVWQYTNDLSYGGGTSDFNAFRGTIDEFRRVLYGSVTEGKGVAEMLRIAIINGKYYVGDGIWHRVIQDWPEHGSLIAAGATEKNYGSDAWLGFGEIGRLDADAVSAAVSELQGRAPVELTDAQFDALSDKMMDYMSTSVIAALESAVRVQIHGATLSGTLFGTLSAPPQSSPPAGGASASA